MSIRTDKISFSEIQRKVMTNFDNLSKADVLFFVDTDRDEIWDIYLSGFEPHLKQEYTCNCCKSFLRQFGNIVAIKDNQMVSLWDNLEDLGECTQAIDNLRLYIHSKPIKDQFLHFEEHLGTRQNRDSKNATVWNHFYSKLPRKFITSKESIPTTIASARDNKNVFKRGLEELTTDSVETVLELIAQNSLYRGKEFEPALKAFLGAQRKFRESDNQDNFCWIESRKSPAISRLRNTAIGTLLIDLSGGMDLDTAVTRFEKVVAPSNYKRPTSLVTPKMIQDAKEKLEELGLRGSLDRRYATETDLNINDVLFSQKMSGLTDVFDDLADSALVNPRSFSKVEEIGIEEFLANVVPTAKSISVLLEGSHLPNLVSLLTAKDSEAPTLFKWNNHFSWSYSGGITDSIKERVKAAGGNVVGVLRTSLSWSNFDDLDLHVTEPNKNTISFKDKVSQTSGTLDVDMNAGGGTTRTPVENIIWTDPLRMREGTYKVMVNNYARRENKDSGFTVEIEFAGEVFDFSFNDNPRSQATTTVVEFTYTQKDGIKFKDNVKSNVLSKTKWGLGTNQFHKVSKVMLSPNHWGEKNVGNKHYLFMLEGCKSDEEPRPFFNEFLKPELDQHRKVFEVLGSKIKVEPDPNQLSGLGFSDTQRHDMIVKVTGKFVRTLRVKF